MGLAMDLRVLELLCSRMAHDLVNPIGAVANGLELLEEGDTSVNGDAIALCRQSTGRASALLQIYRSAYGTVGSQPSFTVEEARRLAMEFVAGGRCTLDWPSAMDLPGRAGAGKLLLNLVLLAAESLPRGGAVAVGQSATAAALTIAVMASGSGARLSDDVSAALAPDAAAEGLTPRSVQAYFAARLAERLGGTLAASVVAPERVSFAVTLSAG